MTTTTDALLRDAVELEQVLLRAAADRPRFQGVDATSGELAWIVNERRAMLDAVNRLRARDGREPVLAERLIAVELTAVGHVDYAHKFALRAAELVHEG